MADLPRLALRLSSATDSRVCAALAGQAERCGFQTVWFAENPYQRGVLPAAAACIAETSEIGIGIGIFNPYNRHPTLMAMEIGALDELSGGQGTRSKQAGSVAIAQFWIDGVKVERRANFGRGENTPGLLLLLAERRQRARLVEPEPFAVKLV